MNFQLLDADYTYDKQQRPVVRLYGRDEAGRSVCCFVPGFEPYFYLKVKDTGIAGKIREQFPEYIKNIEIVRKFEPIGYFRLPVDMLKITVFEPKNVPAIRDELKKIDGVEEIYESDILFRNRFLIDSRLGGMGWVDAEPLERGDTGGIDINSVDCNIKIISNKLKSPDILKNAPLKNLAFDIECLPLNGALPQPEKSPVVMMSIAFEPAFSGKKTLVLTWKKTDCNSADLEVLQSEAAMLNRFFEIIREYDPDFIFGYNTNGFDVPYIVDRMRAIESAGRAGIKSGTGRDRRPWSYRRIATTTRVNLAGRIVADLLPLVRREFSLKQYTLKNTAKELLDLEKLDISPSEMEDHWKDSGAKFQKFVDYARRDSELAMKLLTDLKLFDKYIALAKASGSLLQEILDGGQTPMIENILLREFGKHNRVLPPKPKEEESEVRFGDGEELKGGEVLPPKKGLLSNLVILDYKSLYPTIMMAHNLCYSTVVIGDMPEEVVKSPSGGMFASAKVVKGIVPSILEDLLNKRLETRKKMKTASNEELRVLDATQQALKILLNSFYGYSGYARARLYSLALANAVTSFGRENILKTQRLIENDIKELYISVSKKTSLAVVYGDTDSVFVQLELQPPQPDIEIPMDEAELAGKKIASIVTASLQKPMELVFEAFAKRAIFIAKKRYAIWAFEKTADGWRDKIRVKGMETVRRDWCELTTKTVERVLELVLKEGNVEGAVAYVRDVINSIRQIDPQKDQKLFEDLVLTRQYTKKIESYKNKQPHITVVEKLEKRGIVPSIGDRIPFVIVAGNGLFVDRAEDPDYAKKNNLPLDVDYYINKQILPPVERILSDFGVKGETLRVMGEMKMKKQGEQKKLFEF